MWQDGCKQIKEEREKSGKENKEINENKTVENGRDGKDPYDYSDSKNDKENNKGDSEPSDYTQWGGNSAGDGRSSPGGNVNDAADLVDWEKILEESLYLDYDWNTQQIEEEDGILKL